MEGKYTKNPILKWFYKLPDHQQKWCYFLIAMLCFFVIYKLNEASNQRHFVSSIVAEQNSTGFISVYGPARHPQTIMMMEMLKMYGFTPKIMGNTDSDYIYLTLADGTRVKMPEFTKRITKMKVQDFNPESTNTVVLYGVKDCPYAQKAKDMLEQRAIPYEYIDLNADALTSEGVTNARFLVSGHDMKKAVRNPYLEYNNKIYDTPDLYIVIENIKQ